MPETKQQPIKMTAQCMQCGKSFGSAYEVKQHIRQVHIPERLMKKTEEQEESSALGKVLETATGKQIIQPQKPPIVMASPIVLKYKFYGECSVCRHEPRTLMLEVRDEIYAVAYCSNCDKKLTQVKVISLNYQYEKTTKPKKNSGE